jgi:hypothetical protein
MLTQIPLEIIDLIFGYLDFGDIRSIARVCSAFRPPAQLRLFRTIRIATKTYGAYPHHIESILSSPHLLQYPSVLLVQCFGISTAGHKLWSHLPMMYRLSNMEIYAEPSYCSKMLSALESCDSAREIALRIGYGLAPDMLISDNPLPVHALELMMHASNHHAATRLVQKCSQSLRKFDLFFESDITPTLPFLPHLYEFSVIYLELACMHNDHDLMSWLPFLDQNPTITCLALCTSFTLSVQASPNLLPNLRFLEATPAIIERLIPGRPVNNIHIRYPCDIASRFPLHIILQPLRRPIVPVTVLEITTDTRFSSDVLIDIVQSLPKLRKFTLSEPRYEVRQLFEGRRYSKLIGNRFLSPFKTY